VSSVVETARHAAHCEVAAEIQVNEPRRAAHEASAETVTAIFAEMVQRHPDRIAVSCGALRLTYRALDRRANALANRLAAMGVLPGALVGLCAERSLELMVAILAILKAGAAYAPLDPAYPEERLSYMIGDTDCPVILATREVAKAVPALSQRKLLMLDEGGAADAEADAGPHVPLDGRSLAYVMYTSGSTGRPKGVLVEHRSIVRLVRETDYCGFDASEVWLHFAPLPFDASTLEIWGALLNGARLVMAPPKASLAELGSLIRAEGVTSMWLTSGLFNVMVDERLEDLSGVRQLLAGGDVLSPAHVARVLGRFPAITVINGYGPTENTTFTCCHPMRPGSPVPEPVPIGRPIAGTSVYILDEGRKPVAPGAAGEIYTGGAGVARGYLNSPETTREKFLPDPFAQDPQARMYRTGDLGRWREDGSVEFLGRADNQVKILGHRIEPAEIEAAMGAHPDVAQACIVVHAVEGGTGGKRLIGYYLDRGDGLAPSALRAWLAERLPRYMLPALLVPVCAMPLGPTGKIDRSALPKPPAAEPLASVPDRDDAAGGGVEDQILATWRHILKAAQIGPDDNFFDVGGDSLRLLTVHAELERRLQREILVVDLFEFTSPRALARHLQGADEEPRQRAVRREADEARAGRQRAAFARFQRPAASKAMS
jgi:aspartate racemase